MVRHTICGMVLRQRKWQFIHGGMLKGRHVFPLLVLIGRPAAGKSEIIDYLKHLNPAHRRKRFRIGVLHEIDDFPMLWSWFEEDRLLEQMGEARLHTDGKGYFLMNSLWQLLIRRLELEYRKSKQKDPSFGIRRTALVEFSRGSEHGGYREAFRQFSPQFLSEAAVMYIDVSFRESARKNRRRYNPDQPHSILEHSLPDEKLETLYRDCDWHSLTESDPQYLSIKDQAVPYLTFANEDDVTTRGGSLLGRRLARCLQALWSIYQTSRP
jgi:hypothetical protein